MMLIVIIFPLSIYSQGLQNLGANIVIAQGTYFNISGNLTNQPATSLGVIEVNGKLKLQGNLVSNLQGPCEINFNSPESELILDGTNQQLVKGNLLSFKNITVNNISGVAFSSDVVIEGNLNLTTGVIMLNNHTLNLANGSFILGTPSSTAMIVTGENGEVRKHTTSTGSLNFPVGSFNGTFEYTPVTVTLHTGTFNEDSFIGVNSSPTAIYHSQPYLNRQWEVTQSGISSMNADVSFQYLTTDVTGIESTLHCVRALPLPVTVLDATDVTNHHLTARNLTSFGTFTGGAATKTLYITILLEGLYKGDGIMRQAHDQSASKWPEGVADHFTLELHNGTDYKIVEYSNTDVSLGTNGNASLYLPANTNGNYYVTVKHPNSVETTSAIPVSFAENVIDLSFTNPSNVLGANLKNIKGNNVIYSGDVNGDGIIDRFDMLQVHALSTISTRGYLPADLNGDGLIDLLDLVIIFNNNSLTAGAILP